MMTAKVNTAPGCDWLRLVTTGLPSCDWLTWLQLVSTGCDWLTWLRLASSASMATHVPHASATCPDPQSFFPRGHDCQVCG